MNSVTTLLWVLRVFYSSDLNAQETAARADFSVGGHVKYQAGMDSFPANSLYRDSLGSNSIEQSLATRLNGRLARGDWDFKLDFQIFAIASDSLSVAFAQQAVGTPAGAPVSDDRRWWDLTHEVAQDDQAVVISRFDRLYVGYTSDHTVWRFGRQAISWGNGLFFTPMDVFNPFDPAAVDKEYKTGDDMLYGQWLFANGNDLQGVIVVRRDPMTGQAETDQSSLALKYHGFVAGNEFDILAARHYGEQMLGFGGIVSIGGAIWRGDLTWTKTDSRSVFSAVSSLSYSWAWGGRNISGLLEYYYNGFGQAHGAYRFNDLQENAELFNRLERGELFTVGRHYLAASLTAEISPLFRLSPNLFLNIHDPSALAQLVAQYDWKQDSLLLAAVNIPIGTDGSEYGGIESPVNGKYLSSRANIFLQLAFYF